MNPLRLLWALTLTMLPVPGTTAAEQPIELKTITGTLSGTLALPSSPGPGPVALIVAGSGPTDRDGNTPVLRGRNDSLRLLADALAVAGIASVRYDKRGVGQSTAAAPNEADFRFDDLVADARAWVFKLAADPRFTRVHVIGHSEGALIGTVAAKQPKVASLVLIAGAGEPAPALLRRQLAGRLPPPLAERHEAILAALERGESVADVPPPLMSLYRPSVQPYLISWFKYSPARALAEVTVPCLIVQGDTDLQVRPEDARLLGRGRPDCQVAIVSGMNHVLKAAPPDPARQVAAYEDPSLPLAPELMPLIARFLGQRQ